MSKVQIVEVGLRDGLQNEAVILSQKQRFEFAKRLASAGLERIEAGAFVSPKRVPQMAGSAQLLKQLLLAQKNKKFSTKIRWSALVPNRMGYEQAHEVGVKDIAIFGAVSETFSRKNSNASVAQSFKKFSEYVI